VIVVYDDQVEWAETLDLALEQVFGEGTGGEAVEPPVPAPGGETVGELLEEAAAAFEQADQALTAGDLAEYQRWVEEAQRLIDEAQAALEGAVEAMAGATG
jgi:hypothetical protein